MSRPAPTRIVSSVGLGIGLVVLSALGPTHLAAQEEARPELHGHVTRSGADFEGAEVVLHRVSMVVAGEVDTVRADPQGLFRFTLPSVPREDEEGDVYFASVRHQGILYFGRAVSRAIQLDSVYRIEAFDTLVAPREGVPLPVAVRYVIADQDSTGWQITDLFEISNEGDHTFVAAPDGGLTWQHVLPVAARDPQVGGGSVSPDAAVVSEGRLALSGPISPGQRQFVLRYHIDALDGFEILLSTGTGTVEFLVREPAPDLEVEGLAGVETVEMQPGVTYRRYAGDAPPGGRVRVSAADPPNRLPLEQLAVALALLLAVAGIYAVQRSGGGASPAVVGGDSRPTSAGTQSRDRLLLEVATIDRRLEVESLTDGERARLTRRRADLVARLTRGGS